MIQRLLGYTTVLLTALLTLANNFPLNSHNE